jgi:hypothetical protein
MSMDMQEYQALLQQLKDKYARDVVTKTYVKKPVKHNKPAKLKAKTFKNR